MTKPITSPLAHAHGVTITVKTLEIPASNQALSLISRRNVINPYAPGSCSEHPEPSYPP